MRGTSTISSLASFSISAFAALTSLSLSRSDCSHLSSLIRSSCPIMLSSKYALIVLDQSRLLLCAFVVALLRAVLGFLSWCASNGETFVDFFLQIRSSYDIWLSACFMLNGFCLGSNLIHPKRRLTVCTRRSTQPMARWSPAGAKIILMLCLSQTCCSLLPFRQRAWSILRFRGTPCCTIYLFKNFSILGPLALLYSLTVENFEKRSMQARKYISRPCPSVIGPPKSICISSLGSEHRGRGAHFVFGIKLFRFLPNSVHGLHVFDLFMRSRLISTVVACLSCHCGCACSWRSSCSSES